jgi:WD40 repeat protein
MNMAKTYNSHTSAINSIELSYDKQYIFVSGTTDGCIAKYKICTETEI